MKLINEKAPSISAWGFCILAPQPELEPGTYLLTDKSAIEKPLLYAFCNVKKLDA